jgi:hypothetical protein
MARARESKRIGSQRYLFFDLIFCFSSSKMYFFAMIIEFSITSYSAA